MPVLTSASVVQRIRRYVSGFDSQAQAAAALGVSAQYLNDVLTGHRPPGPKILKSFDLRRVFRYEDIGAHSH